MKSTFFIMPFVLLLAACGSKKNEPAQKPVNKMLTESQRYKKAFAFLGEMKADSALPVFESLVTGKEPARAYNGMGISYLIKKEPARALEAFEKALKADPASYDALSGIGSACLDLKRYEQALDYFRLAMENDPSILDNYRNMAVAFDRLNQRDSALAYAKKFLEVSPEAQYDYDVQLIMKKYGTNP